ncbi:tRNA (adenosine(37)-N6)-threonylcarbamoyltransferase complex ATPase subunit type 1 TsaE [Anatilimnocola floriformis]|uniref:tRNA (adenosine(37)-N6)-threonylcarbamoyltransferase complex ATPase subunit type 1 TsaE n=1 Tax=Anatilimnocola floriformis TaxID=2948575 RepID=UPI0020C4232F|nr:tRNA (adenosine(37)-N6)-threonylcarbamoyltransferase complex ATPase subunit type 1 TsaE [Anatilimnocola floriformis]
MSEYVFSSNSLADTDRLAAMLVSVLPQRATIAFCGTLGAGKTRFVQGLAAAAGIDPADVTSPTFVLCQQYNGSRRLYHLDAYRLHDADEFRELGTDELYDEAALTLIEWADKVEPALPDSYLLIQIEVTGEQTRQFRIEAIGDELGQVIAALRAL